MITQYEKVKLDVVSDIINRKYEIRLEHGESKDDTSVKKKRRVQGHRGTMSREFNQSMP